MMNHDKPRNLWETQPIRHKNHRRLGHVQNHRTSSETSPLLSGRFNLRRSKISGALSVAVRSLFGRLKKLRSKSTRRLDPGEDGCGFVSHTALLSVVAAAGIWTKTRALRKFSYKLIAICKNERPMSATPQHRPYFARCLMWSTHAGPLLTQLQSDSSKQLVLCPCWLPVSSQSLMARSASSLFLSPFSVDCTIYYKIPCISTRNITLRSA